MQTEQAQALNSFPMPFNEGNKALCVYQEASRLFVGHFQQDI